MTIIKVYRSRKVGEEITQVAGAFSLASALEKAQREAGGKKRAQMRRRGERLGYVGIGGFYFVNEAEAKAIDAANATDARYQGAR